MLDRKTKDLRTKIYAKCIGAAISLLLVIGFGTVAQAQFRAAVQGVVSDSAGATVSDATVTLTSNETNRVQTATTGGDGFYRFSSLAPGSYKLTVEKSGFKQQVYDDITVNAENVQGFDVALTAGGVSEVVTVTDEQPALETEDANIRKTISTEEILRLPQAGRDPYELARLAPGVFGAGARGSSGASSNLPNTSGPGGSNVGIFATENQVQISANGQRLSSNNFQIDGTSVNSQTWGGAAVITPSQESVKEVNVTSSTYSAEDGRNSGATVKVVTQNGTNQFHGSAFFKYNDPGWNAFNRFNGIPGASFSLPTRVNLRDKTYGGSIGGRIIKDRLFFFFSFEGLRNRTSNTYEGYVETAQYRQLVAGLRPNSIASRILGQSGIEPRVLAILPQTCAQANFQVDCQQVGNGFDVGSPTGTLGQYVPFSSPNGGGFDGIADVQHVLLLNPTSFTGKQYFTRIDYNITQKDSLAVSTFITPVNAFGADTGAQSRSMADINSKRLNYNTGIVYTRTISSSIINEARFNLTRFGFDETKSNPDVNFGIPRIEIEGLLPGGDRLRFGANRSENTPALLNEKQLDFRDSVSKIFSSQNLKIGVEYRLDLNDDTGIGGARPIYSFSRQWNFANDTPIFEGINADGNGNPAPNDVGYRSGDLGLFVQDDWKIRPNLTLNLGLRYEYFQPIRPHGGELGNLIPGSNGFANATVVSVEKLTKSDYNNFGPQVGFAYSPNWLGENKLVIRGGAGIGYDRLPNALLANARANPPNGARYGICCGTAGPAGGDGFGTPFVDGQIQYVLGSSNSVLSYPRNTVIGGGFDPATGAPRIGQVEIYGTQERLPNAEVYRYSLEGQYDLPLKLTATLGYQGSAGRNFVRIVPEHFIQPSLPSSFGSVYFAQADVNSNYNAMIARLQRRFANGFQFDVNYRFAKSLDNYSYEAPCSCTNQTYPLDNSEEYGPSDFDVRHFFTASGLWDIPFYRSQKGTLGKILGGFQINGIFTRHTGFPWTPKIDASLRSNSNNFFGPIRPILYLGGQPAGNSNSNFLRPGGIFPGGGTRYFSTQINTDSTGTPTYQLNPPGIGRNTFRGPKYESFDMSVSKRFGLPNLGVLGERPNLDLRFNFFNLFNNLNLANFAFDSPGVFVGRSTFGQASDALAGRTVEFQARFSF